MKKIKTILAASAALVALTGCMGASDFDPAMTMTPAEMYASGCQSCHGAMGEGKFGFLLSISGTEASITDIAEKIEKGGHVMPGFPYIEAPQRLLLATYIKTL
ncbi:MAG: cytochrome c [Candidatus Sedimenticola sp. PURPLELP]